LLAVLPTHAEAGDITAAEIRDGLGNDKSPAQQAAWWKEHMAFKVHRISGTVISGPGMIPQILMDIGSNIKVSCYIKRDQIAAAKKLAPGRPIECYGVVGSSWTNLFGLSFYVDTTGATTPE
jgi:hypothetical protein